MKEIASWQPLTFYKHDNLISKYPQSNRKYTFVSYEEFLAKRDENTTFQKEYQKNTSFFEQYKDLYKVAYKPALVQEEVQNCQYSEVSAR